MAALVDTSLPGGTWHRVVPQSQTGGGKEATAEQRTVNQRTWQDNHGFSQAIEVSGAQHTIFCTDHRSTDAEGSPVHPEDMRPDQPGDGHLET